MRRLYIVLCMCALSWNISNAQNNYLVSTNMPVAEETQAISSESASAEQDFINTHFRHYKLCEWTPGMKFMAMPERKDMIIPAFRDGETHREANSGTLKHKIFEYLGTEETDRGAIRFNFDCEGKLYYHEVRNISLEEYCLKPKAGVPTLAFLNDVDIAKELLEGSTLYMRTTKVRVDDPNSTSGYREVSIPLNEEVKVTAIGVGTRSFPVKIVFMDKKGKSYYLPVAISKTNCGMIDDDFIMDNKNKFFPNAFSFSDADKKASEILMSQYGDKTLYLKQEMVCTDTVGTPHKLTRYTHFKIQDLKAEVNSPYCMLTLLADDGNVYKVKAAFKHTSTIGIMLQNDNYFGDMFGVGNLKAKYPDISEDLWKFISQGEVRKGMTADQCRLSLGDPIRIHKAGLNEVWYYKRKALSFYNKVLESIN